MKDWLFYPMIALLASAMVFAALRAGGPAETIDPLNGFEISGIDLQTLTIAPGTTMELKGDKISPISYAVMSAHLKADVAPSAGVFALLGSEYSQAYADKTLKLTVRARAGEQNPSRYFMIGFFKRGIGRLSWQRFTPTSEFADYELTTTLGPYDPEHPELYFGIWPDAKGDQGTIDVEKYLVTVANP